MPDSINNSRDRLLFVAYLAAMWLAPAANSQIPAFPGAEGFGHTTPGGRGGIVYAVTNLSDEINTPGSLRFGLSLTGPRIIIFKVGGEIQLTDHIPVEDPFVTIAGQTAPGDGITLRGAGLRIRTHDVVVRGLRIRVGDDPNGPTPDLRDAIEISSPAENVVVDHCSFSWAIDENGASFEPVSNITFQWCIFSEGLMNSIHGEGPHSMGLLLAKDQARFVSVHHNLFLHNNARNPQVADQGTAEIINNIVYDWGTEAVALERGAKANVIGNVFIHGGDTENKARPPVVLDPDDLSTKAYVRDNSILNNSVNDLDEWLIASGAASQRSFVPLFTPSGIIETPTEQLLSLLAANTGSTFPKRDPVDDRVIYSLLHDVGRIIDSQDEVGGWPSLDPGTALPDEDGDGMPDSWELLNGLDPADATDAQGDADGDGYLNIEEYINGLFVERITIPDAGPDQALCRVTSTRLDGNTPLKGTGTWAVVLGSASIVNPETPDPEVVGLGPGLHEFEWSIRDEGSSGLRDTVSVYVYAYPTDSHAGADQMLCDVTESSLDGNTPVSGVGVWSILSGTGILADTLDPQSPVSGLALGLNEFVWTITGEGGCSSRDTVMVVVDLPPTTAVTKDDRLICNFTTTRISADRALIGTGMWRVLEGSAILDDPTDNNPLATDLQVGDNVFEWTITSGTCPPSKDTLTITTQFTPEPDFSWTVQQQTVSFFAGGSHAESYFWTFGDGATDSVANPVHAYASPGSYLVRLTVSNECASRARPKRVNLEGLSGRMKVLPDTIVVQRAAAGGGVTGTIAVANVGNDSLIIGPIELVTEAGNMLIAAEHPGLIPPGTTEDVTFTLDQDRQGEVFGEIRIFGQNTTDLVVVVGRIARSTYRRAQGSDESEADPFAGEIVKNLVSGKDANETPESVDLFQNFPNPFNPETEIRYSLVEPVRVEIRIFDLVGSEIELLVDGAQPAGYHTVRWDGKNRDGRPMPSGMYFCRFSTGSTTIIRKMLLIR